MARRNIIDWPTIQALIKAEVKKYAFAFNSDHGLLSGLLDDDHPQYARLAGAVFTGPVTLATAPVADLHAATKFYVDGKWTPLTQQGGNNIWNFPVLCGSDGTQPEWWETSGAGATGMTATWEDTAGESLPEIHAECIKCVTGSSGAGAYVYQQLYLADHPLLKTGTVLSASVWVYQATTADMLRLEIWGNMSGSLGSVFTTATDAWTLLELENLTIGGSDTYVEFRVLSLSASDTFYMTMPAVWLGAYNRPWMANPSHYVDYAEEVYSLNPSDTAWHTVSTSVPPGTHTVELGVVINGNGVAGRAHYARPGYSTAAKTAYTTVNSAFGAAANNRAAVLMQLDDQGQFQWAVSNAAASKVAGDIKGAFRWVY